MLLEILFLVKLLLWVTIGNVGSRSPVAKPELKPKSPARSARVFNNTAVYQHNPVCSR